MTTSSEDEDEAEARPGRPNAYWAEQRGGFGGNFRGIPQPKSGQQATHAEDTLGEEDTCWCGQPLGHDWPGKASGAKHPRTEQKVTTTVSEEKIAPRDLRGYNKEVTALIIQSVNGYGCRYRLRNNSIMVWPLDAGKPHIVNQHADSTDVRRFREWFVRHVATKALPEALVADPKRVVDDFDARSKRVTPEIEEAYREEEVTVADVVEVAKALNSPEHEAPEVPEEEVSAWKPYDGRGQVAQHYQMNDQGEVRCIHCGWITADKRAVGGHFNTVHDKEKMRKANWHNREAKAKQSDGIRYTNLHRKVTEALDLLVDLVDYHAPAEVDEQELEALRAENAGLKQLLMAAERRAGEVEAKLALIREGLAL